MRMVLRYTVQFDRRCGHVSRSMFGHRVQLGFVRVTSQNMFLIVDPCVEHIGI